MQNSTTNIIKKFLEHQSDINITENHIEAVGRISTEDDVALVTLLLKYLNVE